MDGGATAKMEYSHFKEKENSFIASNELEFRERRRSCLNRDLKTIFKCFFYFKCSSDVVCHKVFVNAPQSFIKLSYFLFCPYRDSEVLLCNHPLSPDVSPHYQLHFCVFVNR